MSKLLLSCLLFSFTAAFAPKHKMMNHEYYLFVGTYTSGKSKGIYVYKFNSENGKCTLMSTQGGINDPSYLMPSPDGKYLYAVSEADSSVYAYQFDRKNGKLQELNHQTSGGDGPCFISTDKTGKWVFVANYMGGSFSVLPVKEDGSLGTPVTTIQHHGSSVNKSRQSEPHVHCAMISPDNKDLLVSDLGTDKLMIYELNHSTGIPSPAPKPYVLVKPGNGPRHIAFSKDGKYVYLIQEIGAAITVFQHQQGRLTEVQTLSSTPPGFEGKKSAAAIHLSPDGKFVYGSNRSDANDICVFARDPQTGMLTYKSETSSQGKNPRDFTISPEGKYVLAANQNSDDVFLYKRNASTGALTPAGEKLTIPNPVCLKMISASK